MNYRPEIDGLRSLAILPVIFFHAGFTWMTGGFLGVDIFFVISGYLISSIIITEHEKERFSLAHFYERRARRILPALFFVLFSSAIAAWFILSPLQLINFANSALATTGFAANIYFWQHIDYFTGDTNLLPLLHLWSLGIEEQFYFLFPLLFIGLWRKQRLLIGIIAILFIISLFSAGLINDTHRNTAFYLLPTRAWELIAGAGCAFWLHYRPYPLNSTTQQLGAATGLVLLLGSFLLFSAATPHPSFWTVIPVLGTVLIVLCAQPTTYVARLLSLKPFVWIGLLSYSAYLWHQPLFAFTRLVQLQDTLAIPTRYALISLSFVLAAISWRFVEQPFRNRAFLTRRQVFSFSAGAMLFTVAMMASVLIYKGYPQRFNPVQQILFSHQQIATQKISHDPCFLAEEDDSSRLGEHCKLNPDQPMAILGDSHASALWNGLHTVLPLAKYTASGCAPLLGDGTSTWRPLCPGINRFNFAEIAQKQPKAVILHANWWLYVQQLPPEQKDYELTGQALSRTLAHLHQIAPNTQVIVIGDVPQWPPSLVAILSGHAKKGLDTDRLPNPMYADIKQLEQVLQRHVDEKTVFISILDQVCSADGVCTALVPDPDHAQFQPLAWDYGHLSQGGADYVSSLIQPLLPIAPPPLKN